MHTALSSRLTQHNVLKTIIPLRSFSVLSKFATVDPKTLSGTNQYVIDNLVGGQWRPTKSTYDVVDPLNGEVFIRSANTQIDELTPFVESAKLVTKSGQHNPLKSPERFLQYGSIHQKAAEYLHDPEVFDFFTQLIMRTMPKSYAQASAEVRILRIFFENFSGDQVRMLMRGFSQPGDHAGQQSHGYRWPYGPVSVISPFNFPLEIPVMQFMSAAMVGNKPTVKAQAYQGLALEQFMRLLHVCGLPTGDIDLINCRGPVMSHLLLNAPFRMTQFTGGSDTAEQLILALKGRVKVEDAGYDWKILGADVDQLDYVAWQCDQDAYAISGQKCSAQSLLFAHENWLAAGLLDKLQALAGRRSLDDLTISPVMSHTTAQIQAHVDGLLAIPGARLLFGGKALAKHSIPSQYGAYEPTAVFVPLDSILATSEATKMATTELFGPVQTVTSWKDGEDGKILALCERMDHHLTAAVVSKDPVFQQRMLANTVNGTTYAGIRARTTGAPQNHWFGPSGNPLGAGIGTPEAILSTWTCHREIILDNGPLPEGWTTPKAT